MKYIKDFKIFEAVIEPYDFDPAIFALKRIPNISKEDIDRILSPMNVEFVDVGYFISKLQTKKEIELVPDGPAMMFGIKFAAHNVYTDKMYVCVEWNSFLSSLNSRFTKEKVFELLREILRHESIHKQQAGKRDKIIRNLENSPKVPDKYFGSTDEIMAYAQSFVDQCIQRNMSDSAILRQIKGSGRPVSWIEDVYRKLDEKTLRRFKKYVYEYITKERLA